MDGRGAHTATANLRLLRTKYSYELLDATELRTRTSTELKLACQQDALGPGGAIMAHGAHAYAQGQPPD